MGNLGFMEIFIIFIVVMILFGPKKIPQIARELGQGIRKFRSAAEDIKQEIMKETEENPISDIQKEMENAKNSISLNEETKNQEKK